MIRFACTKCGEQLEAPESMRGETVQCPKCLLHEVVSGRNQEFSQDKALEADKADGRKKSIEAEAKVSSKKHESSDLPIRCPKCGSSQIMGGTKGFSAGKAVIGGLLTGGIGLLAGLHGSKKITVSCLKCGNSWKPG